MNNFIVYKHTSPSNKVYIGITSQDPQRRWRADGSGYRQNEKFFNAIKKYGWDNFKHEILFEGLDEKEALKLEKELIQKYNSFSEGYNKSLGGDYGGYTNEVKQKIGNSVKALWKQESYRKHMSQAHEGKGRKGWHHSEETREKISEIVKERCNDSEYRKRLSESAKKRGLDMSKLGRKAWENEESRNKIIESKKGNRYRAKKVICVETNIIYDSTSEAAESVGVTREAIGRVCRGLSKTSKGLHWRFCND